MMVPDYEVVLTQDARRAIQALSREEQLHLASALRRELPGGLRLADIVTAKLPNREYLAKAIAGWLVIYRSMDSDELDRLGAEKSIRPTRGYVIFDVIELMPSEA